MTKWVDVVHGMREPIYARHIEVYLNGVEVSRNCFCARLPSKPRVKVKSEVELLLLDEDGKRYLVDGKNGKEAARKTHKGIVWWKYREDRQHLVKGK